MMPVYHYERFWDASFRFPKWKCLPSWFPICHRVLMFEQKAKILNFHSCQMDFRTIYCLSWHRILRGEFAIIPLKILSFFQCSFHHKEKGKAWQYCVVLCKSLLYIPTYLSGNFPEFEKTLRKSKYLSYNLNK